MSCDCKIVSGIVGAIVIVLGIIVISLVVTSMEKLESDEMGLKYDTFNKYLDDQPFFEGLHSGAPGFDFIIFPGVFNTMSYSGLTCLNNEGVPIRLTISYQYRVRAKELSSVVMQFKDHYGYRRILESTGKAALRDVCSKFNTSQFQSERGIFQEDVRQRLLQRYEEIHCDVTDLQVNDIGRPQAYEDGIRDKESAREDIEVAERQMPRQITEAKTFLKEAETQADITTDKAHSDSRITITRAQMEATSILNAYQQEAKTYKAVISSSGLNFDTDGFLAYMGVRALEDAKEDVYVNMKSPVEFLGKN